MSIAEQLERNKEKIQKLIDKVDYQGKDCEYCNTGVVRGGVCSNRDCRSNTMKNGK